MSAPDLSVVVVSYNVAALLERCLDAILASTTPDSPGAGPGARPRVKTEVFVVDNASADGSVALVRSRFPGVTLIANTRNLGFGAANNQALGRVRGRHVAFVNPDAEVQGDGLAALVRFLDAHPRAAVAGGRLRYGDGAFQHSAFRFPSLGQIALDSFPLHWRLLESRLNGRYPRSWDETAFQMDFPLGAFFAVRRSAMEAVGRFDEGYFMYVEEVDWCHRLKQAGWEVWHCPDALAIHHGGRSTTQHEAAMFVQLHRSRWRFYRKHYSAAFRIGARVLTGAGMLRQAGAAWWAGRRVTPEAAGRRARARACLEVLRL